MKEEKQVISSACLTDERLRHRWSQQKVADRIGTTPGNVSRWERGITSPGPYFRQRLCELFGKSLSELGLLPSNTDLPEHEEHLDQTAPCQIYSTDEEKAPRIDVSLPTHEAGPTFLFREKEGQDAEQQARTYLPRGPSYLRWRRLLLCLLVLASTIYLLLHFNGISVPMSRTDAHSNTVTRSLSNSATAPNTAGTVPSIYGVQGLLVLDDALTSQQTSPDWHFSSPQKQTGCHLRAGYDVIEDESNYCLVNHTSYLTNFVYQIEMTMLQERVGQSAGIMFRTDDALYHYYDFEVSSVDGSYLLLRSDPTESGPDPVIASGYSSGIHQGLHRANVLAVKAMGENLSLYINYQLVTQVRDSSYQMGNIGVGIVHRNNSGRTEAVFQNAKVWTI